MQKKFIIVTLFLLASSNANAELPLCLDNVCLLSDINEYKDITSYSSSSAPKEGECRVNKFIRIDSKRIEATAYRYKNSDKFTVVKIRRTYIPQSYNLKGTRLTPHPESNGKFMHVVDPVMPEEGLSLIHI